MDRRHAVTLVVIAVIAWLPSTISEARPLLYHDSLEAGFGTSSKARGDFDDDGRIDLVVGVFREDNGAGAIHVFPGSTDGITGAADFLIRQSDIPLGADVEDDNFSRSLAAGDFDGDGFDDLAAGAPHKDVVELDEGAFYVIPGSPSGLDPTEATMFSEQDILGADGPEIMDGFGAALAAENLGRGAADDLAIGRGGRRCADERLAAGLASVAARTDTRSPAILVRTSSRATCGDGS